MFFYWTLLTLLNSSPTHTLLPQNTHPHIHTSNSLLFLPPSPRLLALFPYLGAVGVPFSSFPLCLGSLRCFPTSVPSGANAALYIGRSFRYVVCRQALRLPSTWKIRSVLSSPAISSAEAVGWKCRTWTTACETPSRLASTTRVMSSVPPRSSPPRDVFATRLPLCCSSATASGSSSGSAPFVSACASAQAGWPWIYKTLSRAREGEGVSTSSRGPCPVSVLRCRFSLVCV